MFKNTILHTFCSAKDTFLVLEILKVTLEVATAFIMPADSSIALEIIKISSDHIFTS